MIIKSIDYRPWQLRAEQTLLSLLYQKFRSACVSHDLLIRGPLIRDPLHTTIPVCIVVLKESSTQTTY